MSLLALVPARKGSKRIIKKNIKILCGKPLIAWTIEAAKKSKYINKIVVSTDDIKTAEIAKKYGAEVPFIRPAKISGDDAKSVDVVLHALSNLPKFDWLVLLQPTSPLRNPSDIDNIFEFCQKYKGHSAVSVYKFDTQGEDRTQCLNFTYTINKKFKLSLKPITYFNQNSKADLSNVCKLNGAIYLAKMSWFKKYKKFIDKDTIGFEMPKTRSLDIDTINDWNLAAKKVEELDG